MPDSTVDSDSKIKIEPSSAMEKSLLTRRNFHILFGASALTTTGPLFACPTQYEVGVNRGAVEAIPGALHFKDFPLEGGRRLPTMTVAFETYGTLSVERNNAVLVCHGITGHQHAAGYYRPGAAPDGVSECDPGWWHDLIGPNKAIDTNRYYVISANMLGSSYGSTSPASLDPASGCVYGPSFPDLTMMDIVNAQKELLSRLGIERLHAIAGWSYGGYIAFQWAAAYPDSVEGIIVAASSPQGIGNNSGVLRLKSALASHPNWNDGWYYRAGGVAENMASIRLASLESYGMNQVLMSRYPDAVERRAVLSNLSDKWAAHFDANSMIVLRRAADFYNAAKDFERIKSKVLYILATTDTLFPPSRADDVLGRMRNFGIDAEYFELQTAMGHLGPSVDAAKMAPAVSKFLTRVKSN